MASADQLANTPAGLSNGRSSLSAIENRIGTDYGWLHLAIVLPRDGALEADTLAVLPILSIPTRLAHDDDLERTARGGGRVGLVWYIFDTQLVCYYADDVCERWLDVIVVSVTLQQYTKRIRDRAGFGWGGVPGTNLDTTIPSWCTNVPSWYILSTTDRDNDLVLDDDFALHEVRQLYTLVLDEFGFSTMDATLRSLIRQSNLTTVHLDPAVSLPGITPTTIWMDYIRPDSDHWPRSLDKKHIWPGNGGSSHGTGSSQGTAASHTKSASLAWVGAAVVVVVVLGGLAVQEQQRRCWHHRDFALLAAARE
jgi:hypothetical protein